MKFCVDCKHCDGGIQAHCMRDEVLPKREPVHGFPIGYSPTCEDERSRRWFFRSRHCGSEGRFWEPKKS